MARITKILEGTLSTGNTTVTFTDSDIPNSLIRVYATNDDVFPSSITLSGNTLTITYQAQTSTLYIAVELVKAGLEIIDNVTSDDADAALSAKQGKYLKGLIDAITGDVAADDVSYDNTTTGMLATNVQDAIDEVFQSVSDGKELIADAITDKGVETSASDTFATMASNIESISGGSGIDISEYTGRGGSIRNGSTSNTMSLDATKDYIIVGYVRLTSTKNINSCGVTISSNGNAQVLLNTYAQAGTQMPWFYIVHVTGASSFTAVINMSPQETGISAFYKE